MVYAVAEKHGHNATAMLSAQSVETLVRRIIRGADEIIECERNYRRASRPRRRQDWGLKANTLWRASIPGVDYCCLPGMELPNPVADSELLFLTTFSPGIAAALRRDTGEPIWSLDLGGLGGKPPVLEGPLLYAMTAATLYCLEGTSGHENWRFTPYSAKGEWIYTTPVLAGDRLILGDRRGVLWALHRETGQTLWQTQLSEAKSNVNATALIQGDRVFTASNDGEAICCDLETGQVVWRSKLAGPCSEGAMVWANGLLYVSWSRVQLLCPLSGDRLWEHEFGDLVRSFCVAGDYLLVVVEDQLSAFRGCDLCYSQVPTAPLAQVSFIAATGKVYESSLTGLSILEPSTGERIYSIEPRQEII
ncbi:MAG: PQQ-like beta-propeller repeat protein [Candidatus Eremiobacteraeota bacterium]|nr:PQQ-like beta-propeller repeat protein [Candidatus Eremiobacteraeota bacterium]